MNVPLLANDRLVVDQGSGGTGVDQRADRGFADRSEPGDVDANVAPVSPLRPAPVDVLPSIARPPWPRVPL